MLLGDKIMYLRKKQDMTQQQLAEKVGVTHTTIGRIERNEREPRGNTAIKIARALGVTMDFLYSETFDLVQETPDEDEQIKDLVDKIEEIDPIGFAINCRTVVSRLDSLQPEDKEFLRGVLQSLLTRIKESQESGEPNDKD